MAQVENYQVPAHPSGLEMRTQINAIILALIGDNAGPTEPPETYPGMMWGDTTSNTLKRRTNANDGWITIGPIDDFLGDVKTLVSQANDLANTKVAKAGDTMTGRLTMGTDGEAGRGEIAIKRYGDGTAMYIRGPDTNATGIEFVNNAYNSIVMRIEDDGSLRFNGRIRNEVEFWDSDYNGYSARVGQGYVKLARWDGGGYVDFARARDQDYRWRIQYDVNADYLLFLSNGGQPLYFASDGNIHSGGRGWVWDQINNAINNANNRAPNGANCNYNSGLAEIANVETGNPASDFGNPWVMIGLRVTTSSDINRIWPRGVYLRNS
ncbi:hypothetical protein [Paraburkholderia bannensis]|uniref:hypothetical protein n=1 Tax=Paraburkholderia bannensis TaxID=765414 RepID=UPI002AC32782|nr:hypothetical protein [Paraburkholderia bannensis]